MRSPGNGKARGAIPGPNPTTNYQHAHQEQPHRSRWQRRSKRPPLGYYLEFAPVGRRHCFEQIVINCPGVECPGGHVHRSQESISGGWRTGSCGKRYLLVPARSARIPRPRATEQLELRVSA